MSARSLALAAARSLLLATFVLLVAGAAAACPVCTGGETRESQIGYLIGTIALSLSPLLLIGGIAFALWRRARRLAAEAEQADAEASPGARAPVPPARVRPQDVPPAHPVSGRLRRPSAS